jgi:lactate dehydrogenase-like 2-hydroxyacid dehydrogenase
MTAALLDRLPHLQLIASTGPRNAAIDVEAANRRGIEVCHTGYLPAPTIEFTCAASDSAWALGKEKCSKF